MLVIGFVLLTHTNEKEEVPFLAYKLGCNVLLFV